MASMIDRNTPIGTSIVRYWSAVSPITWKTESRGRAPAATSPSTRANWFVSRMNSRTAVTASQVCAVSRKM
jgi:hypothetical protein